MRLSSLRFLIGLLMAAIVGSFVFPSAPRSLKSAIRRERQYKLQRDDENAMRAEIPSRYDTCIVLADGVIGMEPKEMYLKNGHYVINFPVSIPS